MTNLLAMLTSLKWTLCLLWRIHTVYFLLELESFQQPAKPWDERWWKYHGLWCIDGSSTVTIHKNQLTIINNKYTLWVRKASEVCGCGLSNKSNGRGVSLSACLSSKGSFSGARNGWTLKQGMQKRPLLFLPTKSSWVRKSPGPLFELKIQNVNYELLGGFIFIFLNLFALTWRDDPIWLQ